MSDLPPRAMAVSAALRDPGPPAGQSAHQALWDLTNALMLMWADGDALRWADGAAGDGASEMRPFGLPDGASDDMPPLGTSIGAGELGVLGLVVLWILAAGLTVALVRGSAHQSRT